MLAATSYDRHTIAIRSSYACSHSLADTECCPPRYTIVIRSPYGRHTHVAIRWLIPSAGCHVIRSSYDRHTVVIRMYHIHVSYVYASCTYVSYTCVSYARIIRILLTNGSHFGSSIPRSSGQGPPLPGTSHGGVF